MILLKADEFMLLLHRKTLTQKDLSSRKAFPQQNSTTAQTPNTELELNLFQATAMNCLYRFYDITN